MQNLDFDSTDLAAAEDVCRAHSGRIVEDFIGEPTDVFAPGDTTRKPVLRQRAIPYVIVNR